MEHENLIIYMSTKCVLFSSHLLFICDGRIDGAWPRRMCLCERKWIPDI